MAFTLSKVFVVGRLGADPEFRTTTGGKSLLELRVCANVYRGKDKEESAIWYKVTVWEGYADALAKSGMSKGGLVSVHGDLIEDEYTTKDGEVRKSLVILNAEVIPGGSTAGRQESSRGNDRGGRDERGGRAAGSPFGDRGPSHADDATSDAKADDEIPF